MERGGDLRMRKEDGRLSCFERIYSASLKYNIIHDQELISN
jgi:hypothetical protein